MKSGGRKTVALFVNNRPIWRFEMHDIEIPAQKQHAHNGAPCNPIEQKCHFFPSTLLNKTDVLIVK